MGRLNNLFKTIKLFKGSPSNLLKTIKLFKGSTGTGASVLAFPMTQVKETFKGKPRGHLPTALGLTILVTFLKIMAN